MSGLRNTLERHRRGGVFVITHAWKRCGGRNRPVITRAQQLIDVAVPDGVRHCWIGLTGMHAICIAIVIGCNTKACNADRSNNDTRNANDQSFQNTLLRARVVQLKSKYSIYLICQNLRALVDDVRTAFEVNGNTSIYIPALTD